MLPRLDGCVTLHAVPCVGLHASLVAGMGQAGGQHHQQQLSMMHGMIPVGPQPMMMMMMPGTSTMVPDMGGGPSATPASSTGALHGAPLGTNPFNTRASSPAWAAILEQPRQRQPRTQEEALGLGLGLGPRGGGALTRTMLPAPHIAWPVVAIRPHNPCMHACPHPPQRRTPGTRSCQRSRAGPGSSGGAGPGPAASPLAGQGSDKARIIHHSGGPKLKVSNPNAAMGAAGAAAGKPRPPGLVSQLPAVAPWPAAEAQQPSAGAAAAAPALVAASASGHGSAGGMMAGRRAGRHPCSGPLAWQSHASVACVPRGAGRATACVAWDHWS